MKTEVEMKRDLFGFNIRQKSKCEFYCLNDLIDIANKYRINNGKKIISAAQYFNTENSKEFIETLENKYGTVKISSKGRNATTWVHPLLFMDIALWISPDLKVRVYEWFLDNLLKYRNDSGDSFKLMAGAIFENPNFNKSNFAHTISKVSLRIADACGVDTKDPDKWQYATEQQLKLRDKMHEYIALTSSLVTDLDIAVEIGIKKALDVKEKENKNEQQRTA